MSQRKVRHARSYGCVLLPKRSTVSGAHHIGRPLATDAGVSSSNRGGRITLSLIPAVCVTACLAGCASAPSVPSAARNELAPTGKLRVGLILSNQVLVSRDSKTGELQGVTVILGKKLAGRLGVPFEPVGYPNPAALVKSFGGHEWDIACLAFDPARAHEVNFSLPYMVVDNTYLSERADAYAENAHMLSLYSERLPGSRVLAGRYTVIQHAMATPEKSAAAAQYVREFVVESIGDGTIRDAIAHAKLRRARVGP